MSVFLVGFKGDLMHLVALTKGCASAPTAASKAREEKVRFDGIKGSERNPAACSARHSNSQAAQINADNCAKCRCYFGRGAKSDFMAPTVVDTTNFDMSTTPKATIRVLSYASTANSLKCDLKLIINKK